LVNLIDTIEFFNHIHFRPLGEPKELKTKFDAIFEVEKFVKVMDAIKKSAREFVSTIFLV
jgi:hypothetical protein